MDCPDILRRIVETKRSEIRGIRGMRKEFEKRCADMPPPLDFEAALRRGDRLSVIAEVKKASPSAGIIAAEFDPAEIAGAYAEGGADAVSVLTDREYFKGDISYIPLVRSILGNVPILRKDFIMDPAQIFEARAAGADSFLLISAILDVPLLKDLLALGRSLGMEPLVESHDENELERSLEAGAGILGVNNRDLRDFSVDVSRSEKLFSLIPREAVAVSESGIKTPADAARLRSVGFDAVLVGESLMRSGAAAAPGLIRKFQKTDGASPRGIA